MIEKSFSVVARLRPLNEKEITIWKQNEMKKRCSILDCHENLIHVFPCDFDSSSKEKTFYLDGIFNENTSNMDIKQSIGNKIITEIKGGFNFTIFAYGMTGAGKSFTIFGNEKSPGLANLILNECIESLGSGNIEFKMNYCEIYNEKVKDLLNPNSDDNLMIIEDPHKGVYVNDLSEWTISSCKELDEKIKYGNSFRKMANTTGNEFSSRSHAILQLLIKIPNQITPNQNQSYLIPKLSFIDLAGSERAAVSDNKGLRQLEGANINKSLLALGNCINVLSDPKKKGFYVPYRDSKLTRLLKDSLGGNTKTLMIACVSSSFICYEESLNTLKYSTRAMSISKIVKSNVQEVEIRVSKYKEIIENLNTELNELRQIVLVQKDNNSEGNILEELTKKAIEKTEQNYELTQNLLELNRLHRENEEHLKDLLINIDKSKNKNEYTEEANNLLEAMKFNKQIYDENVLKLRENLLMKKALTDQIKMSQNLFPLNQEEILSKEIDELRLQLKDREEKLAGIKNENQDCISIKIPQKFLRKKEEGKVKEAPQKSDFENNEKEFKRYEMNDTKSENNEKQSNQMRKIEIPKLDKISEIQTLNKKLTVDQTDSPIHMTIKLPIKTIKNSKPLEEQNYEEITTPKKGIGIDSDEWSSICKNNNSGSEGYDFKEILEQLEGKNLFSISKRDKNRNFRKKLNELANAIVIHKKGFDGKIQSQVVSLWNEYITDDELILGEEEKNLINHLKKHAEESNFLKQYTNKRHTFNSK